MTRISEKFAALKKEKKKAFIPFITAGDPSIAATEKYLSELQDAGADIIELGVPFTDPLADGPTIQASHMRALKKNVTPQDVLRLVKKARKKITTPIVLMISDNLVQTPDTFDFLKNCADAGVDGLIVPDLAPEEAEEYLSLTKEYGLDTIFLIAPTSTPKRMEMITGASTGFVYLVSLTGTTGARKTLPAEISHFVAHVKNTSQLPVCVGFGISTPDQAKEIAKISDGVIVGSAIVGRIGKKKPIGPFARSLTRAIHSA